MVQKLLNIDLIIENSMKSKQNFLVQFGCVLDIVGKPSMISKRLNLEHFWKLRNK
jgi:hypothetical protein